MTEYFDLVEAKREEYRLDEQVKEWSRQVKYILAENGCIETAYNNGKVERIYHRSFGTHVEGDIVVLKHGMTNKEVRDRFQREQVDRGRM